MRVLFVTSEAYPLAKTGGLADVSRALPIALMDRGLDVRILMPGYPSALTRIEKPRIAAKLDTLLGVDDAVLIEGMMPDSEVPVYLIDSPMLFRRDGGLYQDETGSAWPDNPRRFAHLSHVAAMLAMGRGRVAWTPDVVHANDWHAGLLPLLLSTERGARPRCVFTSHNMAFQGNFPAAAMNDIGIDARFFPDIEFYGQISFLKAGLTFADRVTTVSPTYAREILTPEFGCGMEGVLKARGPAFSGILNGIDADLWNPAIDPFLAQTYKASDIAGKRACKMALQRETGLTENPDVPLFGFVSRLTHQKMADVIAEVVPSIVEMGGQFALVGEGDPRLEAAFVAVQEKFPRDAAVCIGYGEPLAHRLQAGCDILLAPARFEPCGLTQLYALRYGTLPVVRRTGGLADTVVDACTETLLDRSATGFLFDQPDREAVEATVARALALFREPLAWRRLQMQAMAQNFSWDASAAQYADLYRAAGAAPAVVPDYARMDARETESTRQIVR